VTKARRAATGTDSTSGASGDRAPARTGGGARARAEPAQRGRQAALGRATADERGQRPHAGADQDGDEEPHRAAAAARRGLEQVPGGEEGVRVEHARLDPEQHEEGRHGDRGEGGEVPRPPGGDREQHGVGGGERQDQRERVDEPEDDHQQAEEAERGGPLGAGRRADPPRPPARPDHRDHGDRDHDRHPEPRPGAEARLRGDRRLARRCPRQQAAERQQVGHRERRERGHRAQAHHAQAVAHRHPAAPLAGDDVQGQDEHRQHHEQEGEPRHGGPQRLAGEGEAAIGGGHRRLRVEHAEQAVGRVGHHLHPVGGAAPAGTQRALRARRERDRGDAVGDGRPLLAEGLRHGQAHELARQRLRQRRAAAGALHRALGEVPQRQRLTVGAALDPDVDAVPVGLAGGVERYHGGHREVAEALEEPAEAGVADRAAVGRDEELRAGVPRGGRDLGQAQEDGRGARAGRDAHRRVARRDHDDAALAGGALARARYRQVDVLQPQRLAARAGLEVLGLHAPLAARHLGELVVHPAARRLVGSGARGAHRRDGGELGRQPGRPLPVDRRRERRLGAGRGGLQRQQRDDEGDARDQPAGAIETDVQHKGPSPWAGRRGVESRTSCRPTGAEYRNALSGGRA
jgi:hypothetical protein